MKEEINILEQSRVKEIEEAIDDFANEKIRDIENLLNHIDDDLPEKVAEKLWDELHRILE